MKILNQKQVDALTQAIAKAVAEFDLGTIKAKEDGSNTFRFVASDETKDRHGEVIKADGWNVENFLKNPVMFIDHSSWSVRNIAGKATRVYIENKQLIVEGVFTDVTEAGKISQALYNGGFLKTVSVGLLVKKRNEDDEKIIEQAELYEVSFVSVPANPNAISLDAKSFDVAKDLGLIEGEDEEESAVKYVTVEDLQKFKSDIVAEVKTELSAIKSLLDGKSEKQDDFTQSLGEETLKAIARATANGLRDIKASKKQ